LIAQQRQPVGVDRILTPGLKGIVLRLSEGEGCFSVNHVDGIGPYRLGYTRCDKETRRRKDVHKCRDWCSEIWLNDQDTVDVIESERLLAVKLPNGFPFTCRLDRTVRVKQTGRKRIRELKTTGWRLDEYIRRVTDGDQITAYLWAETTFAPDDPPEGAEAEVTYSYRNSHKCAKSELITRSKFELDDYADKLVGLYADLAGRLKLWPRVDPTHISLVWPGMYDETSTVEDEFVSRRRLHPKDLEDVSITSMYGFSINEQRRANTKAFLTEWSKYDDGILGYMAAVGLDNTGHL